MATPRKYAQVQTFTLAGSGVSVAATSMTLSSFKDIDGVLLTMTDFGTKGYMTNEPNNSSFEEGISFSGVTQNSNGTATLTGIKSVLLKYPYTETTGFSKSHAGGTHVIVTNTSGFYNDFGNKINDEAITGYWTVPDPVSALGIANQEYVLSVVNGGPVTFDQVIVSGTSGENLTAGQIIYLKNDGLWYKASASNASTSLSAELGICQLTANTGLATTILISGVDKTQTGMAVGSTYYLANTAGTISATPGTIIIDLGVATAANRLEFQPYFNSRITLNSFFDRFGNASDGDVTIGSNVSLSSDKYYRNLAVNNGFTLTTNGYAIYALQSINNAGVIDNSGGTGGAGQNGGNGSGGGQGTAGIAAGGGTFTAGTAGQLGGFGGGAGSTTGVNGTSKNPSLGANGKAGGTGGAGNGGAAGTGGTAGVATPETLSMDVLGTGVVTSGTEQALKLSYRAIGSSSAASLSTSAGSGSGGGGGTGTAAQTGGGGGGSGATGGIVFLASPSITNTGIISSNGGNGGKGGDQGTSDGGGGGGGGGGTGGLVVMVYGSLTNSGSITVAGGTGGIGGTVAGGSGGFDGTAGSAGLVGVIYKVRTSPN